jgi:glycosyltransferase involved in cell wall biosynthesis
VGLEDFAITPEEAENPNSEMMAMEHLVRTGGMEHSQTRAAEFEWGIDYRGPWETEWDGVHTSVRRHARALSKTGMPLWLTSVNHRMQYLDERGSVVNGFADHTNLSESVRRDVGHLTEKRHRQTFVRIEHRVFSPESVISVAYPRVSQFDPQFARRVNETTVLYTVFERSIPDADTRRAAFALSMLGAVWVPCCRNRKVLIDSGVPAEKVFVVPHPLPATDPIWSTRMRKHANVRLLTVGKWEPRKGQHELIGAFLRQFKPDESVELTMKYSSFGVWENYPLGPKESIVAWLLDETVRSNGWTSENVGSRIRLYNRMFSRLDLLRFFAESDIYVSAGRAEGFDMPALDAKLMGLRLVVMGHGGAEDFCTPTDVLWDSPIEDAHPGYGWKGAKWSGHRISDIQSALQMAVNMADSRQQPILAQRYSEEYVGREMLEHCMSIVNRLGGTPDFKPEPEYSDA